MVGTMKIIYKILIALGISLTLVTLWSLVYGEVSLIEAYKNIFLTSSVVFFIWIFINVYSLFDSIEKNKWFWSLLLMVNFLFGWSVNIYLVSIIPLVYLILSKK